MRGVPGLRGRGLPELCLESPRVVLRARHGRTTDPAQSARPCRSLREQAAGFRADCCGWAGRLVCDTRYVPGRQVPPGTLMARRERCARDPDPRPARMRE